MLKLSHFLLILLSAQCYAESDNEDIKEAAESPLTIEADNGVKCDKEKQICTAFENVIVTKGNFTIYCDSLTTHIRKNADGKMEMWKVVATGNVHMVGAGESEDAYAPMAEYNMDESKIILLSNGKIKPIVVRDEYGLEAQKVIVLIREEDEKKSIDKIQAFEDVMLSAPEEIAFSEFADYNPESHIATLRQNVKIYKKEGKLEGSYAVIDTLNKTSKIIRPSSRVKALILPKNIDKEQKTLHGK